MCPNLEGKFHTFDAIRIPVSRSNGQRSGLEVGGGIPCWPNLAATLFVASDVLILCVANGGVELVQKRRTMNQEWNTFFDSHLYDGRVIHMLIMDQNTKAKLADIEVGVHILANYCRQNSDQPLELPVRPLILNDVTSVSA